MTRGITRYRFAIALAALVAASAESSAQVPVAPGTLPPPTTPGMRYRSLGREFVDKLRYPFYAIPESFAPDPSPPRVVLRPRADGTTVAVPVPPRSVKPLYISGYAGASRPLPRGRALLNPTVRGVPLVPGYGHGPYGHPGHHGGR